MLFVFGAFLYKYFTMNAIIPTNTLDPELFSFPFQTSPVLNTQPKIQILSGVARIASICPTKYCVVFGECLSNPERNTIVNVLVGLEDNRINRINSSSLNLVLQELNDKFLLGTQHKVNFMLTTDNLDTTQFDQLYAPLDDKWLKYVMVEQTAQRTVDRRPYLNKIIKPSNNKNQSIVPDIYKKKDNIKFGKSKLEAAKKANGGIWRISLAQAKEIAEHYNTKLPTRVDPSKKLGNTGIMMYRPEKQTIFLLKGEALQRKTKQNIAKAKAREIN